jgi:hypothetical protein
VNVQFACPACERPSQFEATPSAVWQCPACDHLLPPVAGNDLSTCLVCGNPELYRKKDFPHWLGLTILTFACLAFVVVSLLLYHQWWAWAILLGSAVFDGLLYLCVGDVVVCYRCGAHYRAFPPHPEHKPFELGIAERYRQEKQRREELRLAAEARDRTNPS